MDRHGESDPAGQLLFDGLDDVVWHERFAVVWDIGQIMKIDQREVLYDCGELDEVALAYAITIHKSQGSEFPAVVIPLATQQYLLLQCNLVYTGITRVLAA